MGVAWFCVGVARDLANCSGIPPLDETVVGREILARKPSRQFGGRMESEDPKWCFMLFGASANRACPEVDERTERSVERMMKVIDLARNIRERNNRPLKTPLREMVVVHPDAQFLEDITGKLCEYVREELNVRSVLPCADTSKYTSVRAEPDFSVLGRRVGRAMGAVAKAVKEMDAAAIAAMQLAGEVTVAGHTLSASDIKVRTGGWRLGAGGDGDEGHGGQRQGSWEAVSGCDGRT
ncbi:unnamed protein product [Closterium sp. NIES-65]|nr:unnamed protein product [Closterium sp. NIES-65]